MIETTMTSLGRQSVGDDGAAGSGRPADTVRFGAGERSRLRLLTDPASPVLVYLGVLIGAVGFVLLGIGWAKVAGTLNVGLQFPYLMSVGLPGLALVMLGLVCINVGVRRQDAAERARQMAALVEALRELQQTIER